MMTVWDKAKQTEKPVLIYGTGNGADKIIDELNRLGVDIAGIFASDGFVRSRTFRGFPVISYSEAKKNFGDFLALISFGSQRPEVLENFRKIASERETYSVDVPVYGENIFNEQFYNAHKSEIERVKNLLCDDRSKAVYENVINFKLTGNMDLLFDCETDRKEAYENILRLTDDEIYMDLGAFNGDTVLEFLGNVKKFKKIYCVEPDRKNFSKLEKNTIHLSDTERLNVCISDREGAIPFSVDGGRNSSAERAGGTVKCTTVDNIIGDGGVTYIKFDVEGLEKEAIDGARETIRRYKPKMLVSCYHRSEDVFALPLQIMNIRDDYEVFIRHNPYIPAWDTQFYFI